MKVRLDYVDHGWQFSLEPETETEKCDLDYLATRPKDQITILNTRLSLFIKKKEE